MSRTRITLFAALAVLVLVMAGCSKQEPPFTAADQIPEDRVEAPEGEGEGGGEDGGDAASTARFVAVDIDFSEAPDMVPAGEVTFELVNEDAVPHDVTIEELDDKVVEAQGGATDTGTIELDPGTYTYYCSVAGHRAAGMEGELTVE